jgi:hypothetical protein
MEYHEVRIVAEQGEHERAEECSGSRHLGRNRLREPTAEVGVMPAATDGRGPRFHLRRADLRERHVPELRFDVPQVALGRLHGVRPIGAVAREPRRKPLAHRHPCLARGDVRPGHQRRGLAIEPAGRIALGGEPLRVLLAPVVEAWQSPRWSSVGTSQVADRSPQPELGHA